MNAARWGRIALAVAFLGVGGLTMTQFAETQETSPLKKEPPKLSRKDGERVPPTRRKHSTFMRMKLDASQKVLEGLALEDFDLIQEGAASLEEMSAAEKWRVTNDPIYREHSADYQRAARRLIKEAKEEKLEAAALTWIDMTMQCIECHKWARSNMIAEQPGNAGPQRGKLPE